MNKLTLSLLTAFASTTALAAGAPAYTTQQIGATFLEAPPHRDKNLAPMGSFGTEKVETSVVVTFKDRLIVDRSTFGKEMNLQARGVLPTKQFVDIGPAESSNFGRFSNDRHQMTLTVSTSRLPDQPVIGVSFSGSTRLMLAKSSKVTTVPFQPRQGAVVTVGNERWTASLVEPSTLKLAGGMALGYVADLKLVTDSGQKIRGEKTMSARSTTEKGVAVNQEWQFPQPIAKTQKLEVSIYQDVEEFELPISLMVMKPY